MVTTTYNNNNDSNKIKRSNYRVNKCLVESNEEVKLAN